MVFRCECFRTLSTLPYSKLLVALRLPLVMYTPKLLFHQPPTRHSDYTVTTTIVTLM